MHEQIARVLYHLGVHLLFASSLCAFAWILTSVPRGGATIKYWIWFAVSINFSLPIGAILDKLFAAHLGWATPLTLIGAAGNRLLEHPQLCASLVAVWISGALFMLARLCWRIRNERRDARDAVNRTASDTKRDFLFHRIPVRFGGSGDVPTVDGILRPQIVMPQGIAGRLSERELNAVLIHELTHARRRDNLLRLLHELGLCALWFHPLVWLTGARLALYRELSCDESAIQSNQGPDLFSALAKFADLDGGLLLRAGISSLLHQRLSQRISRLADAQAPASGRAANVLLSAAFGAALVAGVFETVAHTACCFIHK